MFGRFGIWEIALILLMLLSLAAYFVPTIIAIVRHARNIVGIILLNTFGGWTFVGWVIALVWSIRDEKQANQGSNNA